MSASMSVGEAENAPMTLADIAEVSGVKRPVVTMWRRREVVAGARVPFPSPVAVRSGTELFSADAVASWLERTGRGNNPDPRGDLYGRVALPVVAASQTEAVDGAVALLCLKALTGRALAEQDAPDLADLADEVDPDDESSSPRSTAWVPICRRSPRTSRSSPTRHTAWSVRWSASSPEKRLRPPPA